MPKLTQAERTILVNQLLILETLRPEEADHYSIQRKALAEGYEAYFDDCLVRADCAMSIEESSEVFETLNLFRALHSSAKRLGLSEWLAEHYNGRFLGYDGNDEVEVMYMGFVDYLANQLGLYAELELAGHGYINSHSPARQSYRDMRRVWNEIPPEDRNNLTRAQLEEIVDAG